MSMNYVDSLSNVHEFLGEVASAIVSDKFRMSGRRDEANTETLLELGYDNEDIKKELLSLTEKEYAYSTPDMNPKFQHEKPYHIFYKVINGKGVYIKIKLKKNPSNTAFVFCMSFHFARDVIVSFPFK